MFYIDSNEIRRAGSPPSRILGERMSLSLAQFHVLIQGSQLGGLVDKVHPFANLRTAMIYSVLL